MTLTLAPPPETPIEPVIELLHGVRITDPYRWLEDQNSSRTQEWVEEQTAYTQAYLKALPYRERIKRRVTELLDIEAVSNIWKVGGKYFYLKRWRHQEQPSIVMREDGSEEEIVLVDPAKRWEGTAAVTILAVSRDGKRVAYSVRNNGADIHAVEFFDVQQREVLPDQLPAGYYGGLAFSFSGTGIYYIYVPAEKAGTSQRSVLWHAFGTDVQKDAEIFSVGGDPAPQLLMFGLADERRLCYLVKWFDDSHAADLYIHNLAELEPPKKIVERIEAQFHPYPYSFGNRLIAMTDSRAPNYRIVALDLDKSPEENWQELVPECHRRIYGFSITGGLMFVLYVENGNTTVEIYDLDGQKRGILPCPSEGTLQFASWQPEGDTLLYRFTSFSHPPEIRAYHTRTGESELWTQSRVNFQASAIDVTRVSYPSRDGTQIPIYLVSQKEKASGEKVPRPTFLVGYGGFGHIQTPQFAAYSAFLIECGFMFAVANLRGGAEFGEEWHLAGKRHNRQNAIDDFIAAGEWLIENEYTIPGKLAVGGGSNGGLLVGAALTQRPDLFRAVICLGPLLDMFRYHKYIPDGANHWIDEYGSADDENDFLSLRSYSPYHRVQDGAPYPAVLLITGDADTRCHPMHARKMTARLQAATTSQHPILLDNKREWGHVPMQPLSVRIESLTDRLAFLCEELGVSV